MSSLNKENEKRLHLKNYKVRHTLINIVLFSFIVLIVYNSNHIKFEDKYFIVCVLIALGVTVRMWFFTAREVYEVAEGLKIIKGNKTVLVKFEDIEDIKMLSVAKPVKIKLFFKQKNDLGKSVVFVPEETMMNYINFHSESKTFEYLKTKIGTSEKEK